MAEEDSYKAWLEEFRKEVDDLVSGSSVSSTEAGRNAQDAFAAWWRSEQESVLDSRPELAPTRGVPLNSAAAEPRPAEPGRDLAEKIEKLSREKSALESELSRLAQENALLRKRQESFRGVTAELETKISRAREGYESSISRLENQVRLLEEHVRGLQQDKAFLEKTCARLEEDTLLARKREAQSSQELAEARRRLEQYENELRRQMSLYQERIARPPDQAEGEERQP